MEHMGAPAPTGGDDTNDDTPHYGPTAHDLWDTHLATLKLSDPLHPRLLWGLFDGALQAGLDLADNLIGKTPRGEWHGPRGHERMDLAGFGHIKVPHPTTPTKEP